MRNNISFKSLSALILCGTIVLSTSGCQMNGNTVTIIENTTVIEEVQPSESIAPTPTPTPSEEDKESKLLETFQRFSDKIDSYITVENFSEVKEEAKEIFITGVDFIFYGTSINGITFDELSTSAQMKVMNLQLKIDSKIEGKAPNYKENMSEHYQYFKALILEKAEKISTKLGDKIEDKIGKENWDEIKETCSDVKDIASGLWDSIKSGANQGKEKIKTWYENFR